MHINPSPYSRSDWEWHGILIQLRSVYVSGGGGYDSSQRYLMSTRSSQYKYIFIELPFMLKLLRRRLRFHVFEFSPIRIIQWSWSSFYPVFIEMCSLWEKEDGENISVWINNCLFVPTQGRWCHRAAPFSVPLGNRLVTWLGMNELVWSKHGAGI